MALARAAARLDEPAAPLDRLLRDGPLTAAEVVLLAETALGLPDGVERGVRPADVLVTESGSFKLAEVGGPSSAGRLLCEALGVRIRPVK